MSSEIESAIRQICEEKNLSYEAVIGTIESALAAAYRKDFGKKNQNVKVEFNAADIGKSKIYDVKTVVEDLPEEELAEAGGKKRKRKMQKRRKKRSRERKKR